MTHWGRESSFGAQRLRLPPRCSLLPSPASEARRYRYGVLHRALARAIYSRRVMLFMTQRSKSANLGCWVIICDGVVGFDTLRFVTQGT